MRISGAHSVAWSVIYDFLGRGDLEMRSVTYPCYKECSLLYFFFFSFLSTGMECFYSAWVKRRGEELGRGSRELDKKFGNWRVGIIGRVRSLVFF